MNPSEVFIENILFACPLGTVCDKAPLLMCSKIFPWVVALLLAITVMTENHASAIFVPMVPSSSQL